MAKGITETVVHTAADALVAAGERPTVERIRAHLGTGSPNTVTRWLESWWQQLGVRLAQQQRQSALPEAPAEVAALATQLWDAALQAAATHAAAALESEHAALAGERVTLAEERQSQLRELEQQRTSADAAQQSLTLAETRLAELQHRAGQQGEQINDLVQQRDALQARTERLDSELAALGQRLHQQEAAAATERDVQARHLRTTEDRAHAEVDRARQENKELRAALAAHTRDRTTSDKRVLQQLEQARNTATAAQRDASQQRGRAEALVQQLTQLQDLATTLQATLAQARNATMAPKSRSRRRQ